MMTMMQTTATLFVGLLLLCLFSIVALEEVCQEIAACREGDVFVEEKRISSVSNDFRLEKDTTTFFISANGNHEGWLVHVTNVKELLPCHLYMMKQLVAQKIVAEYSYASDAVRQVDLRGPHRLVDEEGKAFPQETSSTRLHLLLPREAFIHQAVELGFVRTLSDGTTLTTLSLDPRVFLVDPILPQQECLELIEISSKSLSKSPEKHYSDAYKNYRTSWTGSTPSNAPLTNKLWNRIKFLSAMPDGGVEHPQLLKYDTNTSWYKQHHDFYHNFESKPLEEVRMFCQTRAIQLLEWNVSNDVTRLLKDESTIQEFDSIEHRMSNALAESLVEALQLQPRKNTSPQRLLHDHLLQSPTSEFERAVHAYATKLLSALGASDPTAMANQYFQLEGVKTNITIMPYYDLQDYVPYVVKPVQQNRHATILPILQAADRGGNTAFPKGESNQMGTTPDVDEEFDECKRGLVVKAESGQALLFYNRLPRGELDYNTIHAGCPPKEGVKYAVNCFTWDSDQNWAFKFLTDVDKMY
jgi:hypothetical protein